MFSGRELFSFVYLLYVSRETGQDKAQIKLRHWFPGRNMCIEGCLGGLSPGH